ncbi:MAG: LysM peptidoglycan-binding domain-containing protein [Bacteroidetes bacterium]|nr:LysM peptidoglycan-binding domain-containing protein [Bacteroidota bacterium]MBP6402931.1 LysM peptidoglycan-binding domain-containing protein [Bacteroidia bacterium]
MEINQMTFEKKLDYFSFVKKLSLPGLWILCSLLFCIDFASAQSLTKKDTSEVRFVNSRKFFIYKVGKGETLFSISQKFRIPQEEIHQFNPDLAREGLKGKMKLWIPAYSWLKKEDIKKEEQKVEDINPKEKEFKTSFFTKLNLSRIYLPGEVHDSSYVHEPLEKEIETNLQFYQGMQSALVRLKGQGLKVHLTVYDTEEDSSRLSKLLFKPELLNQELLITNLGGTELKKLNEYSNKHQSAFLVAGTNVTDQIKMNPQAIALFPSSLLQCRMMGKRAAVLFPDANCIVVKTSQIKENERSLIFRQGWLDTAPDSKVRFADYGKLELKGIIDSLVKGKRNVVFLPSSNEDMVSTIFNSLKEQVGNYQITVVGLPTWQYFETIDPALFDTFQVVLFNAGFVDYKDPQIEQFRRYYRDTYNTEPAEAAYQGYDAMYVAGTLYLRNELKFSSGKSEQKIDGLYSDFLFSKTDAGLCNENKILHFLRFQNFIPELIAE